MDIDLIKETKIVYEDDEVVAWEDMTRLNIFLIKR